MALNLRRVFSDKTIHPYDQVEWSIRDAVIKNHEGGIVFELKNVEFPVSWSQDSVNIVADKYFRGGEFPETSLKQMLDRVCGFIAKEAFNSGYINKRSEAILREDLIFLTLNQYFSFNSPVWFNVGLNYAYGLVEKGDQYLFGWDESEGRVVKCDPYIRPQASACFIVSIDDSIEGIFESMKESARLFKYGSGIGADWSKLRSSKDVLSGGGKPSGPVTFMKVQDSVGGTIKSGGKTRRAAIMQTLRSWHPDVAEFIEAKMTEEKKAHMLIEAGVDGSFNGPAYGTVSFQNVNQSLRVDDAFMGAATGEDSTYELRSPATGKVLATDDASRLLDLIAEGTHVCGDPGVQYEDEIQRWHTSPSFGDINSSNPCCFVGDTLVDTTEGRIPIKDLVGMRDLPHVFSFDTLTKEPVIRKILKAWKAGEVNKLIEVTTDKGITLKCTPEHRFLTYDGRWVEAQNLTQGTRLRKISRAKNEKRSNRRMLYSRSFGSGVYESRFMWEQVNGEIPAGYDVHHINEDPTDNRLSNLELIPKSEHVKQHSSGASNSRYIDVSNEELLEVYESVLSTPRGTHKSSGEQFTSARWNRMVRSLKSRAPLARGDGRIRGKSWGEFEAEVKAIASAANDRVAEVRVIELESNVGVFDIEVEGSHNFAVTNSVDVLHTIIVHNSEYMFLDDTACNLGSFNLLKFYKGSEKWYDTNALTEATYLVTLAMDVLVDAAGYPSEAIAENSHKFRPLGIGYTNLGATLMAIGVPYDSNLGRSIGGGLIALIDSSSMLLSSEIAEHKGSFHGFEENKERLIDIVKRRMSAINAALDNKSQKHIGDRQVFWEMAEDIWKAGHFQYDCATNMIRARGMRNAQHTVLAPTGTISFMMGCDTTGIEPDLALVKHKLLAGAGDGRMKIVNETIPVALANLGYPESEIEVILKYVHKHGFIEGAQYIRDIDLPIFDTSFQGEGTRVIGWQAHIKMMAACQPFISGAISKTVNMPSTATVQDIREAYILGWKLKLKALAIYRDGSKRSQPLSTSLQSNQAVSAGVVSVTTHDAEDNELTFGVAESDAGKLLKAFENLHGEIARLENVVDNINEKTIDDIYQARNTPVRKRLPDERPSTTVKFTVGGAEGYMHVGLYEETMMPGEIFISMSKEGSAISALMDAFATAISIALQYGVPLESLVNKFSGIRFDPSGFTRDPLIPMAKSCLDYIFLYLGQVFVDKTREYSLSRCYAPKKLQQEAPEAEVKEYVEAVFRNVLLEEKQEEKPSAPPVDVSGPPCDRCGQFTVPSGSCHSCPSCGNTSGCG